MKYANKETYEGAFKDEMRHGFGAFVTQHLYQISEIESHPLNQRLRRTLGQ